MIEFAVLTSLFLAVGFTSPWWSIVIPAIIYGFWRGGRACESQQQPKALVLVVVTCASAVAWNIPAVMQDFEVAGRVSVRLAGLMGLKGGIFAYLLTTLIASVSANLGLAVGMTSRKALR